MTNLGLILLKRYDVLSFDKQSHSGLKLLPFSSSGNTSEMKGVKMLLNTFVPISHCIDYRGIFARKLLSTYPLLFRNLYLTLGIEENAEVKSVWCIHLLQKIQARKTLYFPYM